MTDQKGMPAPVVVPEDHIWLVNPKGNPVAVPLAWWSMDIFIAKTPYTGANTTPDRVRKWYEASNPMNKTLHASYHPLPPYRVATEDEVKAKHPHLPFKGAKPAAVTAAAKPEAVVLREQVTTLMSLVESQSHQIAQLMESATKPIAPPRHDEADLKSHPIGAKEEKPK